MCAGARTFHTGGVRGRMIVQLRFSRENGHSRPIAASGKQGGSGARVTLEVEREALEVGSIHVLYRLGAADVVVAGSVHRERVEAALRGLGDAARAYRITEIPVAT
jgi:hypothetical protein